MDKKIHNIKFRFGKKNPKHIFLKKNLRTVSSFSLESGAVIWCRKQLANDNCVEKKDIYIYMIKQQF